MLCDVQRILVLVTAGLNFQADILKRKQAYHSGLAQLALWISRRPVLGMVLLSARRQQPRPVHSQDEFRIAVVFVGWLLSGGLVLVNGFFVSAPAVRPSFPTSSAACHRCGFAGIGQARCSASALAAATEALEMDEVTVMMLCCVQWG